MSETKNQKTTPKRAVDRRPIAAHSSTGIRLGARTVQTFRAGSGGAAHEARVDALTWHPLGIVVSAGGRDLVIPAARLDWVELELEG